MFKYYEKVKVAIEEAKNNRSKVNFLNILDRLKEVENICVFGAGKVFLDSYIRDGWDKVIGANLLVDNDPNKWGKEYNGLKCINIEELKNYRDVLIIIYVFNPNPIIDQLEDVGLNNYFLIGDIWNVVIDGYNKLDYNYFFEKNLPRIKQALDIFEDEESKLVFTEVFCNKVARHLAVQSYKKLFFGREYFNNMLSLNQEECFVDGGAYTEDTLEMFLEATNNQFEKIYSFEMNKSNYSKLSQNVKQYSMDIQQKIELFNCGVWNKKEEVCSHGANEGHSLKMGSEYQNDGTVLLDTLDSMLENKKVTFIKLDIEGAEIEALEGATRILKEQKPKLAICAYHCFTDLWEIPLKIKELNSEYKVYLRHHSSIDSRETVAYGV